VTVLAGPSGVYRATSPLSRTPVATTSGVGASADHAMAGAVPVGSPPDDALDVLDALDDTNPLLGPPWRSSGQRPRWIIVVLAPVVAGAVASAVIGRVFLAAGAVGFLVAVDRMVTTGQDKFHYVAEFGWPNHFESASTLAWFAVAALGADALVQEVRDRRARRSLPALDPPTDPTTVPAADEGTEKGPRRRRGLHVRPK
jgi:hypothetical protein